VGVLLTPPVLFLLTDGLDRGCACGAGLAGAAGRGGGGGAGDEVLFFWPPEANAEEVIRTRNIIDIFNVFLFSMINLLMISYWSESSPGDFTSENGRKLEIP
jgi:hypothetical protein